MVQVKDMRLNQIWIIAQWKQDVYDNNKSCKKRDQEECSYADFYT